MAVDTVEMKLFFEDNYALTMRNINDVHLNEIITNAFVKKMALDWIGRRIFWTSSPNKISVANFDGNDRKVVTNTVGFPRGIAIDSLSG